jgi:hypothetical protein
MATKPSNEMRADIVHFVIAALCATALHFPGILLRIQSNKHEYSIINRSGPFISQCKMRLCVQNVMFVWSKCEDGVPSLVSAWVVT